MKRRFRHLSVAVLALVALTGCWNNRAIEHRAIVLVIGVDRGPNGEVEAEFQVPQPNALVGFTSTSGGSTTKPTSFVVNGFGKTFAQATTQAQSTSDRQLFFGQVQMVILSTRLKPEQVNRTLEYFARVGPLDKTAFIAVTPDPVAKILAYQPEGARFAALYFTTLFSCTTCQEVGLERNIWNIEQRYGTPGSDNWLPVITPSGANYRVAQVALYRGPHLAGTLTQSQTVYFGYLIGKTARASLAVDTPLGTVGLRSLEARPRLSAHIHGTHAVLDADLHVQATIDTLPMGEATPRNLHAIEQAASQHILAHTIDVLQTLQHDDVDPLNFFRAKVWQHPELRSRWRGMLRNATLRVRVTTRIVDVGDTT